MEGQLSLCGPETHPYGALCHWPEYRSALPIPIHAAFAWIWASADRSSSDLALLRKTYLDSLIEMKILLLTPWFPNPENPNLGNFILRQFELIAKQHDVFLLAFSANGTARKNVSCESTEKYGFKGWHITHRSGQGPLSWRYAREGRSLGLSLLEKEQFVPELVHAQIAHQIGDLLYRIKKNHSIPILCSEHCS